MNKLVKLFLTGVLSLSLCACSSSSDKEERKDLTFEETTLFDTDDCKMTITEMTNDGSLTMKAELENKRSDVEEMFTVDYATLNGYTIDPSFASSVAAGAKSSETITFNEDDLEEAGIVDVTDIQLSIRVYNNEDITGDDYVDETYTLYPLGEDASSTYTRESSDDDEVLLDEKDVKVILVGKDPDNIWGYTLKLYLENNTKKDLMFACDACNVNGYSIDPLFAAYIKSNSKGYVHMSFSSSELEENDIDEVTEVKIPLRVYDENSFDDLLSKTLDVKIK